MKATLTLINGDVHNFKSRAIMESIDQGMFVLANPHTRTTLFICQATDVQSYLSTGTPKAPKQPKKNSSVLARLLDEMKADDVGLVEILKQRITPTTVKGESLTLDITATTAEAFLEEVNKLLDDEDSHLLSTLVAKIGDKLTDRFASTIDSQAMSISGLSSSLGNLQVSHSMLQSAVQVLQQPVVTSTLVPPQPFPLAVPPSAAPAPVAINQAYVEEAKPADAAEGKPLNKDSRAVLEHEKVNGFCRECDKMTRHSVTCATLLARRNETPTGVQDVACDANVPVAE